MRGYRNVADETNIRAVRKAVDIINKYIDEESVYLPDVLDKNSETYWQLDEYVGSDWNIDADAIVNDWIADQSCDKEYDLNPTGLDPRIYLFNILCDVLGYNYEDANRILNL